LFRLAASRLKDAFDAFSREGALRSLATGCWLTRERVYLVTAIIGLGSLSLIAWLYVTSAGTVDILNRPLGNDFSNVWTAGMMALDGRAAEVWDWDAHFQVQQQFHGNRDIDLFGWHYPPPFLLVATALATMPYLSALVVWQATTLAPLLAMLTRLVRRRDTWLFVLAAPATLVCLTHGHNGFLTALLLGGGLLWLDKRPFLAGLLLGCLIYKPQFGLILPPLMLASRHWRAILGACSSAAMLVGMTLAIWGMPVWQAFIDSLPLTRVVIIEQGITGWHKIMSPFAAIRMWGGGVALAYAGQLIASLMCIAAVAWIGWTGKRPYLRNALVCSAVLISTPYLLDYDYVVLLPAIAFLFVDGRRHAFHPWDATLLAFAWFAPLVARTLAEYAMLPVGLLSAIAIAGIALRRAWRPTIKQSSTEP
jgi:hypothetical protein